MLIWEKDGAEMVFIPAGEFEYGSDFWMDNTVPKRIEYLPAFWIDRHEVTNAQYKLFVDETGHRVPFVGENWSADYDWGNGIYPEGKENHPVVLIDWHDAHAYCEWTGKRLPSEKEWEKAARGTKGYHYPWATGFDAARANTNRDGMKGTTPVCSYSPQGDSPYGLCDAAGNAEEWTADWYNEDEMHKVLRGGSWGFYAVGARCAARAFNVPTALSVYNGVRCAVDAQ